MAFWSTVTVPRPLPLQILVFTIANSCVFNNGGAGVRNENATQIDARNVWWGDASGPSGIGPGSGDALVGNALFEPWLEDDLCMAISYRLYLPGVLNR